MSGIPWPPPARPAPSALALHWPDNTQLQAMLLGGAGVVVVDEAHEMRNAATHYCTTLGKIATPRRLALTGYPLQARRKGGGVMGGRGGGREVTQPGYAKTLTAQCLAAQWPP